VEVELATGAADAPRYLGKVWIDAEGKTSAQPDSSAPGFAMSLVTAQSPTLPTPLEDAYTAIEESGWLAPVVRALAKSMRGLVDLRILKKGREFLLHCVFEDGHAVPMYLAGDGSKRLIELALAMRGIGEGGVALIEEPECYQHPRHLREFASFVMESAKANRQVVISTHSIELVDLLLEAADAQGTDYPFVHRVRLVEGTLSGIVLDRARATFSRKELLEDLRA
jgi:hypothetical protein